MEGIKIIRSRRRRKTISARMLNDTLYIHAPERLSEIHLQQAIDSFKKRFQRHRIQQELKASRPLAEIAEKLNQRYFNGQLVITSIEYVTNQFRKFGCCNYRDRRIRISHQVAKMPEWVRDYVIIHEMAHLIEPNHSRDFWTLVSRYELTERARGFLIAKGMDADEEGVETRDESESTVDGPQSTGTVDCGPWIEDTGN